MNLVATRWQEQEVRNWDRSGAFFSKKSWQFPQIFATAASLLTLVVVLTDTHFVVNNDGIAVKFGRSGYVSEATLADFSDSQKTSLNQNLQRLTAQQIASNQLVLKTILDTSHQERRQDMGTLVSYWNAAQAEQFQQTEPELRYLLASQAEDEKDIKQLSDAFTEIRRGNNM